MKLTQRRMWIVEAMMDGGRYRSFVMKAKNPFKATDRLLGAKCWREVVSVEIYRCVWHKYKKDDYQLAGQKGTVFAILDQRGTRDHKGRPVPAGVLKGTGWLCVHERDMVVGGPREEKSDSATVQESGDTAYTTKPVVVEVKQRQA